VRWKSKQGEEAEHVPGMKGEMETLVFVGMKENCEAK